MNKKKIGLILLLCICIFPLKLKAVLPDTYEISQDGKVNALYSYAHWIKESTKKEYLTKSECESKGGKVDTSDWQKWYGYFSVTCGIDASKTGYASCQKKYSISGKGSSGNKAKTNCLNNAIERRATASCYNYSGIEFPTYITPSNIGYGKVIDGQAQYGNTEYGMWAKSDPDGVGKGLYENNRNEKSIRYACITTNSKGESGSKSLAQAKYITDSGADAYCVMPGTSFKPQTYKKVDEFDLTGCKSSNDNYYCGLAATVKEAEINYNADYLTTLTALRLWTADQRQGGQGWWDPENDTKFVNNLYLTTADYINNNGYSGSSSNPGVDEVLYGDSNSATKLQNAISIYKKVKEGKEISIFEPYVEYVKTASTSCDRSGKCTIPIYFKSNFASADKIKSVYSSRIGTLTKPKSIQFNVKTKVGEDCHRLGFHRVCDDIFEYFDYVDGVRGYFPNNMPNNSYIIESDNTCSGLESGEYCYKLTLYKIDRNVLDNLDIKVTVDYTESDNIITSVGYYHAKENPQKYQYMVIFDRDKKDEELQFDLSIMIPPAPVCEYKVEEGTWYDINSQPVDYAGYVESCTCTIIDGKKYVQYPTVATDEEYHNECEKVTCDLEKPKDDNMPDTCDETIENSEEPNIEDPQICNILNREEENDEEKDYLTDYGNAYCNIYCREELKFTFMPKETALAGQSFSHSVETKYLPQDFFSTVILSTRQCASTIKYDKWKDKYQTANLKVLNTWNELKYWEALYNWGSPKGEPDTAAGGGCSGCSCSRADHPTYEAWWGSAQYQYTHENGRITTETAYESDTGDSATCDYSCCCGHDENGDCNCDTCCGSCSSATSADLGIVKREYRKALENYKGALDEREKLLYYLLDCNFMNDKNTIYKTSSKYLTVADGSHTTDVELTTYDRIVKDFPEPTVNIMYDEIDPDKEYHNDYDIKEMKISIGREPSEVFLVDERYSTFDNWVEYCGEGGYTYDTINVEDSCSNDLTDLSPEMSYDNLIDGYWKCSGSGVNAYCYKDLSVNIPQNRLANIVLEKEYGYYQENEMYTQVMTGLVRNTPSSLGYWIKLDDYIYPVGIKRPTGSYDMTVSYSDLNAPDRVVEFDSGDLECGYNVINDLSNYKCDDDVPYHECYPCVGEDCEPSTSSNLGVYFRTIDLNDVFPNSQYSPVNINTLVTAKRKIGYNWTTYNAIQVINEIQKLGDKAYTEQPYQYKVTLTPTDIKQIKQYNKRLENGNQGGYLNFSLNCDDNIYCTSNFLNKDLKDILNLSGNNRYADLYEMTDKARIHSYKEGDD